MGYEIKKTEDYLAGHTFEVNGAIALKNYSAQIEGNKIKITSANNSALSIIECEVDELEIDGKIYDNPVDAQNALKSIIYNDIPIIVLTTEEKQKLILKTNKNDPDAKKIFLCDGTIIKPDDIIKNYLNKIYLGGNNLILNGGLETVLKNSEKTKNQWEKEIYLVYRIVKMLNPQTEYTLSFDYKCSKNMKGLDVFFVSGNTTNISKKDSIYISENKLRDTHVNEYKRFAFTFKTGDVSIRNYIRFDNNGSTDDNPSNIYIKNVQLETGYIQSDFKPCYEDLIDTAPIELFNNCYHSDLIGETKPHGKFKKFVDGKHQYGRLIKCKNTNNIIIKFKENKIKNCTTTYQKLGLGEIHFLAENDINLIEVDNTNILNGKKGSTATVTVDGKDVYLRISNS